jgi:hypothetical protein
VLIWLRRLGLVTLAVVLAVGGFLVAVSEYGEVVVIRTQGPAGPRDTRIWVVDVPEGLLVRGTVGKPWVDGLRANPLVELRRADVWRSYRGLEQFGEQANQRANDLMLAKYGFCEQVIALMRDLDTSVSFLLVNPAP